MGEPWGAWVTVGLRERSQRLGSESVTRAGRAESNAPADGVAENELFAPGMLCAPEEQDALVLELVLGADAAELGEEGAEPGVVVVYMFAEASAGAGEGEEGGEGEVGGDVGERLRGKVEEGSMLGVAVWGRV
jgi:hypothetical protein